MVRSGLSIGGPVIRHGRRAAPVCGDFHCRNFKRGDDANFAVIVDEIMRNEPSGDAEVA